MLATTKTIVTRTGTSMSTFRMLTLCCIVLCSCVRVKPYERERHASPVMNKENTQAETKIDSHVEEYREGSVGGGGVGGGGCGCN